MGRKIVSHSTVTSIQFGRNDPWNEKHKVFSRRDPYPYIPFQEETKSISSRILFLFTLLIAIILL